MIQECEDPAITEDEEYKKFASNYLWVGYKNKGLGIFAKDTIILKDNQWKTYGLEWFISCTVNDEFSLLGVWGCGNYIKDIYVYLELHIEKLKGMLICGDFNSNSCWDRKHKRRSHSAVVNGLENLGLYSCYHLKENEVQGEEKKPTFFLYSTKENPCHIDYFFCEKEKVNGLEIGEFEDWIRLSDHMPVILDTNTSI